MTAVAAFRLEAPPNTVATYLICGSPSWLILCEIGLLYTIHLPLSNLTITESDEACAWALSCKGA